eukprot:m.165558 g.165558  ORF g.165558 m.165558 type:complete len:1104 (-) comp31387_c0_seq1:205-3516(-)
MRRSSKVLFAPETTAVNVNMRRVTPNTNAKPSNRQQNSNSQELKKQEAADEDLKDAISQIIHLRQVKVTLVEENDKLKTEWTEVRDQLAIAEEKCTDASKQMTQALSMRGQLMNEIQQATEQLKQAKDETAQAVQSQSISEAKTTELQEQVIALQQNLEHLKHEATQTHTTVAERDDQIGQLTRQLEKFHENSGSSITEVENLKAALAASKTDIATSTQAFENAKSTIAQLESKNNSLMQDLQEFTQKNLKQATETDDLKQQLKQLREVDLANAVLAGTSRKAEVDMLTRQQDKLQDRNQTLSGEVSNAKAQAVEYKVKLDHAVQTSSALEQKLAQDKETFDKETESLKDNIRSLEHTMSLQGEQSVESDALKLKLTAAETKCTQLQTSLTTLSTKLTNEQTNSNELTQKLEASEVQINQLHADLNSHKKDKAEMEEKLNLVTTESKKIQDEIVASASVLDETKTALAAAQASLTSSNHERNLVQTSLTDAQKHLEQLQQAKLEWEKGAQTDTQALKAQLAGSEAKTAELETTLLALETELKQNRSQLTAAIEDVAKLNKANSVAQEELETEKLRASNFEKEREDLSVKFTSLKKGKDRIEAELVARKEEIEELEDKYSQVEGSTSKLKRDLSSTKNTQKMNDTRIKELEDERDRQFELVASLESKLRAAEYKLKANVQSEGSRSTQFEELLADANARSQRLEESLKSTRDDNKTELSRMEERIEKLKAELAQQTTEADQLAITTREATKTAKEAEEKLNVLETQYLESQQRLAMAQNELETVKTEYEHSHTEMQQGYAAHTQLQSQYETTKAELLESNENFGKLGELLQEQSESNQHLTQQLESIRSGNNDLSSHAEELIAQVETLQDSIRVVEAELEETKQLKASELQVQADGFHRMLEQVRVEAQQQQMEEAKLHAESHTALVDMIAPLKQELTTLGKSKSELIAEVQQKQEELEASVQTVTEIKEQATALEKQNKDLSSQIDDNVESIAALQTEINALKDTASQSSESKNIANALGQDNDLMRKLLECQQENAKLRRVIQLKDSPRTARANAPKAASIGDKLKLATAQAQLAKCKEQLSARDAELQAAVDELNTLKGSE